MKVEQEKRAARTALIALGHGHVVGGDLALREYGLLDGEKPRGETFVVYRTENFGEFDPSRAREAVQGALSKVGHRNVSVGFDAAVLESQPTSADLRAMSFEDCVRVKAATVAEGRASLGDVMDLQKMGEVLGERGIDTILATSRRPINPYALQRGLREAASMAPENHERWARYLGPGMDHGKHFRRLENLLAISEDLKLTKKVADAVQARMEAHEKTADLREAQGDLRKMQADLSSNTSSTSRRVQEFLGRDFQNEAHLKTAEVDRLRQSAEAYRRRAESAESSLSAAATALGSRRLVGEHATLRPIPDPADPLEQAWRGASEQVRESVPTARYDLPTYGQTVGESRARPSATRKNGDRPRRHEVARLRAAGAERRHGRPAPGVDGGPAAGTPRHDGSQQKPRARATRR